MHLLPQSIISHPYYNQGLKALRFLQFLLAVVSLGLFSAHLARLVGKVNVAHGVVEGIIASAVIYTGIATLVVYLMETDHLTVKVFLMLMDIVFVGAFVAVAVLTAPGGRAALARCRGASSSS